MIYNNFDIWIDRRNTNGYLVRAASTQLGEARGSLSLDPHEPEWQDRLDRLARRDTDHDFLIQLGTRLYGDLFNGEIRSLFDKSFGEVLAEEESGIRLRLRIEPPEISVLPWELLYSPSENCFLSTSIRSPLVRYLELQQRIQALETLLPLRMLVAIPENVEPYYPNLDAAEEKEHLLEAIRDLERDVECKFLQGKVTYLNINDELRDTRYHCFHFIGHGIFEGDKGAVILNSEDGGIDLVDEECFAELFRNHPTMKLVVLNSCKGATVSSSKSMVGMAPQLVKLGIPAVIAMQYAIYDQSAILFARELYHSLFEGWDKGRIEVAISNARHILASTLPDDRDLCTPVLFLRARNGILFNPVTGKLARDLPIPRQDIQRLRLVEEAHRDNIEILEKSDDPGRQEALKKEQEELNRIRQRIRFRNYSLVSAAGMALFMFFLSFMGLFDILYLDTVIESYTVALADPFIDRETAEKLTIVPISTDTEKSLNKSYYSEPSSWRAEHAELVDRLTRAKTKVIVFDILFSEFNNNRSFDQEFLTSINNAIANNTAIILASDDYEGRNPILPAELRKAASGAGVSCAGTKSGYVWTAPLTIIKKDNRVIPSLTLTAYAAYRDAWIGNDLVQMDRLKVDYQNRRISFSSERLEPVDVEFSELNKRLTDSEGCPTIGKADTYAVADRIIDFSSMEREEYAKVLRQMTDEELQRRFENKIAIIGVTIQQMDLHNIHGWPNERVYGLEIIANGINTLLSDRPTIRSLGEGGQLLIMICLGLIGALIRYWTQGMPRLWSKILVLAVLAGYLGATIYTYDQQAVLLNMLYHIGALYSAYWAAGKVERKWFS